MLIKDLLIGTKIVVSQFRNRKLDKKYDAIVIYHEEDYSLIGFFDLGYCSETFISSNLRTPEKIELLKLHLDINPRRFCCILNHSAYSTHFELTENVPNQKCAVCLIPCPHQKEADNFKCKFCEMIDANI